MKSIPQAVVVAAITLCALPVSAQSLSRKPYLQMGTPTSMTIVWRTDTAAQGVVAYGPSPDQLTETVTDSAVTKQHEVTLNNLTPATRYYYRVGTTDTVLSAASEDQYFVTSPPVGTDAKTRLWVVGDSGTGETKQKDVRDAMLAAVGARRPDLYLHMGDIAYSSGTDSEFTSTFFKIYEGVLQNTVTWPTIGNHDASSADSATETGPYYDAYVLPRAGQAGGIPSGTEAYYSFDYANIHFVVLDSQDTSTDPSGAQMMWLQEDLLANTQEWIIAYWHHPPYSKGSHDSDDESKLIAMRENALPLLEAAGVDLVLSGHSHIYERSFLVDSAYDTPTTAGNHILDNGDGKPLGDGPYSKPDGVQPHQGAVYVVAGHGGKSVSGTGGHPLMYFTEKQNGSVIIDVQGNRLSAVNIRWDGQQSDHFAMVKGTGLMLLAPNGGESLTAGSEATVQWVTVGSVANVKVEFSSDDGQTWQTVTASAPNTGSYAWTVPQVNTTRGQLRISSAGDANVLDETNASFTISGAVPVPTQDAGTPAEDAGTSPGSGSGASSTGGAATSGASATSSTGGPAGSTSSSGAAGDSSAAVGGTSSTGGAPGTSTSSGGPGTSSTGGAPGSSSSQPTSGAASTSGAPGSSSAPATSGAASSSGSPAPGTSSTSSSTGGPSQPGASSGAARAEDPPASDDGGGNAPLFGCASTAGSAVVPLVAWPLALLLFRRRRR
ncbi:MAG: metallophosphoesterase [Myxococcota bacterium]